MDPPLYLSLSLSLLVFSGETKVEIATILLQLSGDSWEIRNGRFIVPPLRDKPATVSQLHGKDHLLEGAHLSLIVLVSSRALPLVCSEKWLQQLCTPGLQCVTDKHVMYSRISLYTTIPNGKSNLTSAS
jgi:hypothetical protein